jgi:hypothetical protein
MGCSECKFLKLFSHCGHENSSFFRKKVKENEECDYFDKSEALQNYNDAMVSFIGDKKEKAFSHFLKALDIGLPEDKEGFARLILGDLYFINSEFEKGIGEIEEALLLDSKFDMKILKKDELRIDTFRKFEAACTIISDRIKEESGLDGAIDFLEEKLKFVEYLNGEFFPAIRFTLGRYFLEKADEKIALDEDYIDELNKGKSQIKKSLEVEYDVNSEFHIETRTKAQNGLNNLADETNDKKKSDKGACFIATAVYGDNNASEVILLKSYRDEYLLSNIIGRSLIKLYYRISPQIAEFLKENIELLKIVKVFLINPVVRVLEFYFKKKIHLK